jgi:hypothetical protein
MNHGVDRDVRANFQHNGEQGGESESRIPQNRLDSVTQLCHQAELKHEPAYLMQNTHADDRGARRTR